MADDQQPRLREIISLLPAVPNLAMENHHCLDRNPWETINLWWIFTRLAKQLEVLTEDSRLMLSRKSHKTSKTNLQSRYELL